MTVDADAETREAIARQMGLTAVERFVAELTVAPLRGGLRAQGRLSARIEQPSVVSFEPVWQDIDEPIDRVFLPAQKSSTPPTPERKSMSTLMTTIFRITSMGRRWI